MHSMTGFGQAAGENNRFRCSVHLRSVNHRFLDVALRLREELRAGEAEIRELVTQKLQRGRVEVTIEVETIALDLPQIRVDEAMIVALHRVGARLLEQGLIVEGLRLGDLLRLPNLVQLGTGQPELRPEDRDLVLTVLEAALTQLVEAREREGEKLKAALVLRLDALRQLLRSLQSRSAELPAALASGLRQRISELVQAPSPDPDRLAQEVAILVDRSDVSEELDRLASHLEHFQSILDQDGSIGKRLDFLAQEILRELNTAGNKCRDREMIHWVLEGKVLCEQLREQVQNVE